MKILHYFLGFPPYRTGGLTKYAFDLMKSQVTDGNEVIALWPGQIKSYSAKPLLKERERVERIRNIELINPLPVSLDEGINEFEAFTKPCDIYIYSSFLERERPDVIHIHTLMGLHREFIQAANQLKIKSVFTSHDYFGLCPKVTLYRYGECCDNDDGCRNCIQCNLYPLSLKKIQLMQSPIYRWAKDTTIVKKLRKQHRDQFFEEDVLPDLPDCDVEFLAKKYRELRAYYVGMYESIDFIHFNSTIAEEVYKRYIVPKDSAVVSITHSDIKNHRDNGHIDSKKIRIYCLAPAKPFKGWNVLKEVCDQLWSEGVNIELNIYGPVPSASDYMVVHENGYKYRELPLMMKNADVVISPSICYETFGFTVIEALSYGVPVIVSDHMGAKDIIGNSGIVVKTGDVNELKSAIMKISNYNHFSSVKSWKSFVKEIYRFYFEVRECD